MGSTKYHTLIHVIIIGNVIIWDHVCTQYKNCACAYLNSCGYVRGLLKDLCKQLLYIQQSRHYYAELSLHPPVFTLYMYLLFAVRSSTTLCGKDLHF